MENIKNIIKKSIEVKETLLHNEKQIEIIQKIVDLCVKVLQDGGAIYWCGNGGSAADAQHLSAELSGRFYFDREPLKSDALHCNTSYVTAVGNDYGYDIIYSRLIKGLARKGDIIIGISTSGKSKNIVNAFKTAKEIGVHTIGFTGKNGNDFTDLTDLLFQTDSTDTPRIQETHILVGHIICEMIEERMFK